MKTRLILVCLAAAAASWAAAGAYVDPIDLNQTSDGDTLSNGDSVTFQNILNYNALDPWIGYKTYDSYSGGVYSGHGDQSDSRVFGGTSSAKVIVQYAGYASSTTLWWYDASTAGTPQLQTIDFVNGEATIDATGIFGLALNNGHGNTYYSEEWRNVANQGGVDPGDALHQHLAVIGGTTAMGGRAGQFFMGWEDLPSGFGTGEPDYNDFVLTLKGAVGYGPSGTPEPFTLALCAGGLGLAIARRRRTRKV